MSRIVIDGLDRLQRHIKSMSNPAKTFDAAFAKVTRQSTRNLIATTPKKTGNTRRGWSTPKKIAPSHYLIDNDPKNGGIPIARILNDGRKEIRPKNSKLLYIPLTNKGASKKSGEPIPKGLKFGVDYVLAKKSRAYPGTKYMTKEVDDAGKRLGQEMIATVRRIHNGR